MFVSVSVCHQSVIICFIGLSVVCHWSVCCLSVHLSVQFVVTGGSSNRLEGFAKLLSERLDLECKIMSRTDRFAFFKVGPVICVNVSVSLLSHTCVCVCVCVFVFVCVFVCVCVCVCM